MFLRDQLHKCFAMRFEQLAVLHHHAGALHRRRGTPAGQGGACGRHGARDIRRAAQGYLADNFAGGRVRHFAEAAIGISRRDACAANPMLDTFGAHSLIHVDVREIAVGGRASARGGRSP